MTPISKALTRQGTKSTVDERLDRLNTYLGCRLGRYEKRQESPPVVSHHS
ncbi:hypothetical protein SAMN04490178_12357 [Propionispora vibrioides]|jgi:hypothetical protein|uniref:Uncharacterized protein n=1 Tax=Propionispora vibrioides TaxID=112903 RepID=A0A1H8XFR8_9FIRM|nr:hypothetical protein SAMN04490178_12357 [Propionispora vibrioides]